MFWADKDHNNYLSSGKLILSKKEISFLKIKDTSTVDFFELLGDDDSYVSGFLTVSCLQDEAIYLLDNPIQIGKVMLVKPSGTSLHIPNAEIKISGLGKYLEWLDVSFSAKNFVKAPVYP